MSAARSIMSALAELDRRPCVGREFAVLREIRARRMADRRRVRRACGCGSRGPHKGTCGEASRKAGV